jgi:peptide-O-fucosyltransferase
LINVNLDSNDISDKTDIWDKPWPEVKRSSAAKDAFGGPYIGVHLRRKDFLYARKEELPSLEGAAKTIKALMEEYNVNKVFIATDGVDNERNKLTKMLGEDVVSKKICDYLKNSSNCM